MREILSALPDCSGVPSAPGVALGRAVIAYNTVDLDSIPDRHIGDPENEQRRFLQAVSAAKSDIEMMWTRLQEHLPMEEQSLFEAYLNILDSQVFIQEVCDRIAEYQWAPAALRDIVKRHMAIFSSMEDPYLQERGSDVADLGRRVMGHLSRYPQVRSQEGYPDNTILVSEEVTPSMLAEVPEHKLVAIVSSKGSTNSHVAILARAMGIPTVMGAEGVAFLIHDADEVIVDGYTGAIYIGPNESLRKQYQALAAEQKTLQKKLAQLTKLPAETKDGHRIRLLVNTSLVSDIQPSLQVGAEGVGLYRTEVPFLIRDRFPTEEEQYLLYRHLLESFFPKRVNMRTLDAGGDKALPYFSVEEENPALGWRGIRITLDYPEILLTQMRALFRANAGLENAQILLPMISGVSELKEALAIIHRAFDEVRGMGIESAFPAIGIMIEVPSIIYLISEISPYVDFFSVGSNDLTQYMLAVDRNNAEVSERYDSLHPAMLRALRTVITLAHQADKPVNLCGEMAGDPMAALLLLAMGFDSLSMNAISLPRIKWVIRSFAHAEAQDLLTEILGMEDTRSIRERLIDVLEQAGLGVLVGKH